MAPGKHAGRSLRLHVAMADQPGQHPPAHLRLHAGDRSVGQGPGLVEDRLASERRGKETNAKASGRAE